MKCQSALFKVLTHVLRPLQVVGWRQLLRRTVQAFGAEYPGVLAFLHPHAEFLSGTAAQMIMRGVSLIYLKHVPPSGA